MIRDGIVDAVELLLRRDAAVMDAAVRSLWISTVAVLLASLAGIGIGLLLARKTFLGRGGLVLLFRVGMSVPTVAIGLLCYAAFSRRGPLGSLELLYTTWAVVIGEFFLALPIVATWTHGAVLRLAPRVAETAWTLGAGPIRRAATYLNEARLAIVLAVLTAFSRCFTELGIAMMVGGNIHGRTRTLTTATALEVARGEFARGVAMCVILMLIAILLTIAVASLGRADRKASP
ncbi:MAG: ABC transporter permease [Planctomycetota bacterium]|nr:ABC transporter permease [Planctomycetota bacterium]